MTVRVVCSAAGGSGEDRRSGDGRGSTPLDALSTSFGCWNTPPQQPGPLDVGRGLLLGVPALDALWDQLTAVTGLRELLSRYPGTQGTEPLSASFSALRQAERDESVPPECFVATHGAFDALSHALAPLAAGSPVAYATPGFVLDVPIRRAGHRPLPVPWPLREPVSAWLERVGRELRRVGQPSGLLVNFPANPGGAVATQQDWQQLLDLVDRHQVLLVVDDVYGFLDPTPRLDLLSRGDVVVVDSLSKRLGAPGLRLGYAMTGTRNLAAVRASAATTSVGVSPLVAAVGTAALSVYLKDGLAGRVTDELRRRRDEVRRVLHPLGDSAVLREHAFYGCLRIRRDRLSPLQRRLADSGLLLSASDAPDPHLRFCLGARPDLSEPLALLLPVVADAALDDGVQPPLRLPSPRIPSSRDRARLRAAADALEEGDPGAALGLLDRLDASHRGAGSPGDRLVRTVGQGLRMRAEAGRSAAGNPYCQPPVDGSTMLTAFEALNGHTPFVRFGYAAANAAITGLPVTALHVVDVGIGNGTQWFPLLDALARRPNPPRLRLTGVDLPAPGPDPAAALRGVGERLRLAADRLGLLFDYRGLPLPMEQLTPGHLDLDPGQTLVVNLVLALHHSATDLTTGTSARDQLLTRLRQARPALLTLVEPDAEHDRLPLGERVGEALRHYGAVFDSLDCLIPSGSRARRTLEEQFFGREIVNIVACDGLERVERHHRHRVWAERLQAAGFTRVDLTGHRRTAATQAGVRPPAAVTVDDGTLVLAWRQTPLLSASAWTCSTVAGPHGPALSRSRCTS